MIPLPALMRILCSRVGLFVPFLLPALLAWPVTLAGTPEPAAGGPISVAWDPAVLAFSPKCARTLLQSERSSRCVLEMTLDSSGVPHVFMAESPSLRDLHVDDRAIEHFVLSGNEVHRLPPIPAEHAPVMALRAAAAHTGELLLLWAEAETYGPEGRRSTIYLSSYRDGVWGSRETVSDRRALSFVLDNREMALVTNADGSLDVFWRDVREYHPLVALLTMGHDGDYSKTHHRRRTGAGWTDVERIQRRGTFDLMAFHVQPNSGGLPFVLWSEDTNSPATIFRSAHSRGRWRVETEIAQCTATLEEPRVFDLAVTPGVAAPSRVAWACSGFEYTEPGTQKNTLFVDLYVTALLDGVWTTGPVLTRNAVSFRWLWNGRAQSALVVQESAPRVLETKRLPVPLSIVSIDRNRPVATEVLTDRSLPGIVEAVADDHGTVHLIYAEPATDTGAILKYRRGRIVAGE